jgi:hypothetical protein
MTQSTSAEWPASAVSAGRAETRSAQARTRAQTMMPTTVALTKDTSVAP